MKNIKSILFCILGFFILVSIVKAETVLKSDEWLKSGEGKTLVLSRSFVLPPLGANGEPLYKTTEERDKYYIDLGIWQKAEFREYDIKSISWVHNELPSYLNPIPEGGGTYLKSRPVDFKALLPEAVERWGGTQKQRRYIIPKKIIRYGEDNVIAVNVSSWTGRHPIGDGYIRLINPAKGETLDLSNLEWFSKKGVGELHGIASWARY